jgi:diadenylate cyclase
MSAVRTGALIVIENEVPLGDIETTGTKLDARVTHQLLISIFEDKMPLHDGAVVISKSRLASAGCYLPLSPNNDLLKNMGTRHRAALGMTENSDAVVVVVSEETGIISIVVDGKISRGFSQISLRDYLKKLLAENITVKKPAIVKKRGRDVDEGTRNISKQ